MNPFRPPGNMHHWNITEACHLAFPVLLIPYPWNVLLLRLWIERSRNKFGYPYAFKNLWEIFFFPLTPSRLDKQPGNVSLNLYHSLLSEDTSSVDKLGPHALYQVGCRILKGNRKLNNNTFIDFTCLKQKRNQLFDQIRFFSKFNLSMFLFLVLS